MMRSGLSAFLPLSWLYAAGLEAYLLPYNLGIRKRRRLPCRVVSVGNLTFGGTGKSPAVRAICEGLLSRGLKPAVLSRGHGGRLCIQGAIVSDGNNRLLEPVDCGDEPAVHADMLPGVPVAIGKDRLSSGKLLIEQYKPDVIVLDDGMQYWQLHRDLEIALVRADKPFGNGRLLPAGDLREPPKGLRRADVIVITEVSGFPPDYVNKLEAKLHKIAPKADLMKANKAPRALINVETGERLPLSRIKDLPVLAVSGLANPTSFENMAKEVSADIRERLRFGDHCSYSKKEIERVTQAFNACGARAVLTTAKDAVKFRLPNMYILDIELQIDNLDYLLDLIVGTAV